MNYVVFDLEFNQNYNFIDENKNEAIKKNIFEIIQIGAVKLDESLQTISSFNRLIKPQIFTNIHPFVEKITGITMEKLTTAKPFKEVYKEFIELIGEESILCVWGMSDITELFKNVQYYKLPSSLIPREYINIQPYASKYLNCPNKSNIGLRNAIEFLNLPINNSFHDGFNDACYTADVFRTIYSKQIKVKFYYPNQNKKLNRISHKNQKLDTFKLIKQFEKMYNRELTEEEQSMIKLAYMMGKTNQFQV